MTHTRARHLLVAAVLGISMAAVPPLASPATAAPSGPRLTITDAAVTEGNSGTVDLVFTVKPSTTSSRGIAVAYNSGGGTATATTDYTPSQGNLTLKPRQKSATIRVPVIGDTTVEPNETVEVRLSNPAGATIADGTGIGTIRNDDTAPPPDPVLTVVKSGTGTGTVTSNPTGIACGSDCVETYPRGSSVTLTAAPDPGSIFTGWTGGCTGTAPCSLSLSSDASVTATFGPAPNETATLNAWIDGWGSGTVTSNPAGINCHIAYPAGYPYESDPDEGPTSSGPCDARFPVGTVVTVTATPDPGNSLNGLDCGTSLASGNTCTRTVNSGYNAVWSMFCPLGGLCSAG